MTAADAARDIAALFARLASEGVAVSHHWDECLTVERADREHDDFRSSALCSLDFDQFSNVWTAHHQDAVGKWVPLEAQQ